MSAKSLLRYRGGVGSLGQVGGIERDVLHVGIGQHHDVGLAGAVHNIQPLLTINTSEIGKLLFSPNYNDMTLCLIR